MKLIKARVELLKQMHQYVLALNDEEIYYFWCTRLMELGENEISENLFYTIALEDEDWSFIVSVFNNISKMELMKEG